MNRAGALLGAVGIAAPSLGNGMEVDESDSPDSPPDQPLTAKTRAARARLPRPCSKGIVKESTTELPILDVFGRVNQVRESCGREHRCEVPITGNPYVVPQLIVAPPSSTVTRHPAALGGSQAQGRPRSLDPGFLVFLGEKVRQRR